MGGGGWTRDAVRLEKLLEDASIKLSAVASSVTTVWARAMLAELVAGNRDARRCRTWRSRRSPQDPGPDRGTDGYFDDSHALLVGVMLHRLDHVHAALLELDATLLPAVTHRGQTIWSC
jgi:transposase